MKNEYTAVVKQDGDWWIGWIEEVPGVNCQEATREELIETLRITLAEAIEATFGPQDSAKGQSVALNAELASKTSEMNALKSQLRHIVKNYTKTNPGAYAAWNTAVHVEKAPSKPKPPPTP